MLSRAVSARTIKPEAEFDRQRLETAGSAGHLAALTTSGDRFPLDRAAHGRDLFRGSLAGLGNFLHGQIEVAAQVRGVWVGAPGIEPAAVLQAEVGVEAKEVRGADRTIGPGHRLILVVEVGERKGVA